MRVRTNRTSVLCVEGHTTKSRDQIIAKSLGEFRTKGGREGGRCNAGVVHILEDVVLARKETLLSGRD